VTKLKITIPIPKRHHFKENHSSSSSHQTRKKNGRPSIAITPAITTVGRLIIWRRPHGILWLYEKPEKGNRERRVQDREESSSAATAPETKHSSRKKKSKRKAGTRGVDEKQKQRGVTLANHHLRLR